MRATLRTVRDPFRPAHCAVATLRRRRRIRALAPRTRQPHICLLNGRAILRSEWRRRVADGDDIRFVVLPLGGGGDGRKNPMQMLLSIAVMVYAPQLAGAMLGEAGAIQVIGSITLKTVVSSAIGFAGNALIGAAFAGKPSMPTPQVQSAMASPSPTYNLQAQGNLARLDAAVPAQYGRLIAYPDFAAQPYAEFVGNEQYLYQLFALGLGYYDVEQIRIDDTDIGSFPDISYEILDPGESLTLFPANVATSVEVTGQTAEYDTWLGGFIANAASTEANAIAIDVVAPRGLYYYNDSGGFANASIEFTVEARTVDSGGTPTSSYATLGSEVLVAATNTPQRYSFRYAVAAGRYEVRLKRTTAPGGTSRFGDELVWFSLRAYLPETTTWDDTTVVAMRMRASNSLSGQASRKINMIATRKLPVYDADTSTWSAPQATRNPAWAMADVLRADYGGGMPDARINLAQLATLAAAYASRGDSFDARFDSTLTLWEALVRIGQAVRTKPYLQGGIVNFARDAAATVPVAMFSTRNMAPGSFAVEYSLPTGETADSVTARYFDADVWTWQTVTATLPSGTTAKPVKAELFGVTDRDHAYREAMYLAAVNRYRRKTIRFQTEMEGLIPSFGDLIAISHDMPAWGTAGEVTAYDSGTKAITLSEPVSFGAGTHYIGLRKADGSVSGPYVVTAGADAYEVIHAGTLDFTPTTDNSAEPTHFSFGAGETWRQPARVVAVRPQSLTEVEIEAINEDDAVHTADEGITPPAATYSALPALYTRPAVTGLTVRAAVNDPGTLLVSWAPAAGARYYLVEVSADGARWSRVASGTATNASVPGVYGGSGLVRVAAVGLGVGAWAQTAFGTATAYFWSGTDSDPFWTSDSNAFWSA